MKKYKLIAKTVIFIEADSVDDALDRFYDEVYEVDRHGDVTVEELS